MCVKRQQAYLLTKEIESRTKKQGRFPSTLKTFVSVLFQIKGSIRGKDITISIAPSEWNNYISDEFANELVIPESNIGERLDFWNNKEYAITYLQWNIGDYTGVSHFIVISLWSCDDDLILGLPWLETLGTFILNVEKKFLIFPYKKKKITLQYINMKSKSEVVLAKDFKEISKVISQEDGKSI